MHNDSKFWMVWDDGGHSPTHKHASRELAQQEAERLAKKVRGRRFVVLEAVAACCVTEVHWTALIDEEMPF